MESDKQRRKNSVLDSFGIFSVTLQKNTSNFFQSYIASRLIFIPAKSKEMEKKDEKKRESLFLCKMSAVGVNFLRNQPHQNFSSEQNIWIYEFIIVDKLQTFHKKVIENN